MKKFIVAALAVVSVWGTAKAEGYQINSLSAKQIGMGHTGIALKLGAESMFFNPAGMAYMDKTLDLSGSVTGIMPTCTATVDNVDYTTDNGVSTPIGVHAAFSIYDNLKGGISFYTPYGSSINWTDNWPGAVLNQNVNLKVFTIQPTLAWAITPKFSIGAGAMVSWGTVDLNKGLVTAETTDKAINALKTIGQLPAETPAFGSTTPASVNLNGKADMVVGFNVGAMYNITENLTVGASYRSQMKMKVKAGDAHVKYANAVAQGILGESLDLINEANFKAEMPCPWVMGLGVSYKPVDRLTLAFDARLTGWHAYKRLDIEFLAEQLTPYNQNITKKYKNSWCYSLGGQYAVTDRFDARLGLMIDTSPVNDKYYNPETPGMTKIEPTVGLSFRPIPSLSIDLAFMYVAGLGIDNASCEYNDLLGATMIKKLTDAGIPSSMIDAMGFKPTGTFTADYKLHAFIPSIGISYSF
ncbi:outer membrane protein transport protein [uncultured Duncaniella sp.]|uniref:OmpP1/FadL family transporter n=1 Tax=uncultured Duncaniella sp. TaxID=2768039 RepID=UPI0025D60108|nr:outer membrane protein transport protein [uncultured Duncaniella sp.]